MALTGAPRRFIPERPAVLVADPDPDRLRRVTAALARECRVDLARDGEHATSVLARGGYAAAVVNAALPTLSGLDALRQLANRPLPRRPLVLAIGAAGDVRLSVIRTHKLADLVQTTPCADALLLRRIWSLLDVEVERRLAGLPREQLQALRASRTLLELGASAIARGAGLPLAAIAAAGSALVAALASGGIVPMLDELRCHHDYTYVHSLRVAAHLASFALETGMRAADTLLLAQAGLLHDLGKAAVSAAILDKPGPLADEEWRVVRQHPGAGGAVLRRTLDVPPRLVAITERHHERLDGSGYPRGLAGAEIDEPSLLCAIADVHTALTDRRAYRGAMSDDEAFARMRELGARQLDQALLRRYQEVIRDGAIATGRRPATEVRQLLPA